MGKAKIVLLIILGILAAIATFFPISIIFGLMFFIVPGIVLTCALSIFIYYAGSLVLGIALKFFKVPFPTLIALVSLVGIGCLISYNLNKPIIDKVNEFKSLDVASNGEFNIPDTIAIYSSHYLRYKNMCNELCQLLLFNKAAKQVLIITDLSVINAAPNTMVTSYSLERGEHCKSDNIPSERWSGLTKNVENRIAGGECIVQHTTNLAEASYIFVQEKILQNHLYQDYKNLKRRVIFVDYVELLKNTGNNFEKDYRYSEISAQPFVYPLSLGPILGAGGGNMSLNFGFFHYTFTVNDPGPSYGDPIQEYKTQMNKIFGKALDPIEASN